MGHDHFRPTQTKQALLFAFGSGLNAQQGVMQDRAEIVPLDMLLNGSINRRTQKFKPAFSGRAVPIAHRTPFRSRQDHGAHPGGKALQFVQGGVDGLRFEGNGARNDLAEVEDAAPGILQQQG